MKFMRGSRGGGAKFIEDVLEKNPGQHYAFVTGSPVLRKPLHCKIWMTLWVPSGVPRTVALAECFVFFALSLSASRFGRVHPKIEIWLEVKIVSAEPGASILDVSRGSRVPKGKSRLPLACS